MWSPTSWAELFSTSQLTRWLGEAASVAPEQLEQPILPGWIVGSVVNVTGQNSAAPDTEAAIVQTSSYGRQLGRISDALRVLIEERTESGAPPNEALTAFSTMWAEIESVKTAAAASRITQLRHDLETLRHQDGARYRQVRSELLGALDVGEPAEVTARSSDRSRAR
jgi:hypothetical protein